MKIDFTAHHAIDDVKVNLAYMKHISKENDKNLFDIIEPYERIDSIFKVNNTFINKTIWYIKLLHNAFIGKKYTFDDSMNENKKACRRCISLFALFGMEYTFLNNADFCVCYSTCGQQTLTKTIIYLNFDRIFIDLRNEIRSLPKISDSLNDESIMKVIKKFKEEFELLVKN
jgi:hypothetical protein